MKMAEKFHCAGELENNASTVVHVADNDTGAIVKVWVGTDYPDSGRASIQVDGVTVVPHAPHTKAGREAQDAVDWFQSLPKPMMNRINALFDYWTTIGRIYDESGEDANKLAAMDAVPYPLPYTA